MIKADDEVHKLNMLEGFLQVQGPKPTPVLNEIVKDEIWIVDNFLSKEECDYLIKVSEKAGYVEALVNVGNGIGMLDKGYRDSKRVMIDDIPFAEYMTERCLPYLPRAY